MKTAVSIPDEIFQKTERLAQRAGRSRSDVVALDRARLDECVAKPPRAKVDLLLWGVDVVLGR